MIIRTHRQWQRAALLAAAGCALVAGTATAALASVPGSSHAPAPASSATIHACAAPAGQLRTIAAGKSCLSGETALSWPGKASVPSYYVNESAISTVAPGTIAQATASCNSGDLATGGGGLQNYGVAGPSSAMVMIQDFPTGTGATNAWRVDYYNSSTSTSYQFVTYVDCVHMP